MDVARNQIAVDKAIEHHYPLYHEFWRGEFQENRRANSLAAPFAYLAGMGGYLVTVPIRIALLAKELFLLIGRALICRPTRLQGRQVLVNGASLLSAIVGILLPLVAYRIDHTLMKRYPSSFSSVRRQLAKVPRPSPERRGSANYSFKFIDRHKNKIAQAYQLLQEYTINLEDVPLGVDFELPVEIWLFLIIRGYQSIPTEDVIDEQMNTLLTTAQEAWRKILTGSGLGENNHVQILIGELMSQFKNDEAEDKGIYFRFAQKLRAIYTHFHTRYWTHFSTTWAENAPK